MDRDSTASTRISGAADGVKSLDEIHLLSRFGQIKGLPAHLVGVGHLLGKVRFQVLRVGERLEWLVDDRRSDSVEPRSQIFSARCGEGAARQLFRV